MKPTITLPEEVSDLIARTERAGGGILVYDRDDVIVAVNDRAREMYSHLDFSRRITFSDLVYAGLRSGMLDAPEAYDDPEGWIANANVSRRQADDVRHIIRYSAVAGPRVLLAHNKALGPDWRVAIRLDITDSFPMLSRHGENGGSLAETMALVPPGSGLGDFDMAAAILDRNGVLLDSNPQMMSLLESGDGLEIERGQVCGAHREDTFALTAALRRIEAGGRGELIPIRRARALHPLALVVSSSIPSAWWRGMPTTPGVALVTAVVPDAPAIIDAAVFGRMYGLTPAEAKIAAGLAAGLTAQQIADADQKSVGTVRNQLKRVMQKVGVSRQAELISIGLQLARAARTL